MKPVISPVQDPLLQKNFSSIRECLGGKISFDNMNYQVIEGTTSSDVDSQSKIIHSMSPRPSGWFPLVGDIYVQEISDQHIDVRSTKPSVNFKIILIGGPNVVGEAVAEVGPSSYRTTTQVVQETPAITITNITDATVTIEPTIVQSSVFPAWGTTDQGVANTGQVIVDTNYIYVTSTNSTSAGGDLINRFNRTTGERTVIDTNQVIVGVSAMYITPPYLYVCSNGSTSSNITIYRILLSTFTIDTSFTISVSTGSIVDMYVDGTNIYLATTISSVNTKDSAIVRTSLTGTGTTTLTLGVGSSTGSKLCTRIIPVNNDLWCIERQAAGASTSTIYKVSKASFTVSNSYSTASRRLQFRNGVYDGSALWIPAAINTTMSAPTNGLYAAVLFRFDLTTTEFSEFPIPFVGSDSTNASTMFTSNILLSDAYIYLISVSDVSTSGVYITRFDTLDNSYVSAWYPWKVPALVDNTHDNIMTQDVTDGMPVVIWTSGTSTAGLQNNFQFFKPDFSVFG